MFGSARGDDRGSVLPPMRANPLAGYYDLVNFDPAAKMDGETAESE
jgi:hypothetical protein